MTLLLFIEGSALCSNGLFAVAAESGNFALWDIEERKTTLLMPLKGIYQFILHTSDTMVQQLDLSTTTKNQIMLNKIISSLGTCRYE